MSATAQFRLLTTEPQVRPVPAAAQVVEVNVEQDDRLLLTVKEAAHRLGIGRSLMYELLEGGAIQSIHVGRLRKVPVAALTDYVERQSASA